MRRTTTACLIAFAAFACGATAAVSGDLEPVVVPGREGRNALYTWLDDLDYPDGATTRSVWLTAKYRQRELAFVTAEDDAATSVFALDGIRATTADEGTSIEPADLDRAIEERLHGLERAGNGAPDFHWGNAYTLPERTRLVLLARHAHRTGDDALEERLLTVAAAQPGVMERIEQRAGKSLEDLVRADCELFERVATWGGAVMGADLATRRARLVWFAERFPESDFAARAAEEAEILARMIEEAPGIPPEEDLERLSGDALARALVLRLREQSALGGAMGGVMMHTGGQGETPLDRLIALGDVALPALLDAYGDPTLTRAVSTGRVGVHPRTVTVGAAAYEGVQAITGQWFQTAEQARAWLARRDAEGEATLLAEQIFHGNWIDTGAARRLVALDPEVAASTLAALLKQEMTAALRMQLIDELAGAQHEAIAPILRAECADDRPFPVRQIAAHELLARDAEAARAVFLDLWRGDPGLEAITYPARQPVVVLHQDRESAWQRLIPELVAMEAWDEIAALLPEKTEWTRAVMLARVAAGAPSPYAGGAVSRMLLDGASDLDDAPRGAGTGALVNCSDARIADLVGAELATHDDAWQPYRAHAAREDRDIVLEQVRNALRVAVGEEPRVGPIARHIDPLSDADVAPLVAAFESDDLAALDAAEDAVAAAGLAALPALRRAFTASKLHGPSRAAFERGLTRLGTTVGRVIVRERADERAGAAITPFAGRPLDVAALVKTLRAVLDDGVPLTLLVHRPADDTGCTLVVAPPATSQRYRLEMGGASHRYLDDDAWRTVRELLLGSAESSVSEGWSLIIQLR